MKKTIRAILLNEYPYFELMVVDQSEEKLLKIHGFQTSLSGFPE
jgi:hypothetical protein